MAAELLTDASRALDANGNPFAGAKWYFYVSGTLTPQAVYANSDLSTSLGSVVEADAGGKFVGIYFDASKKYRGILENATGTTTIYDYDPINPGILFDLGQESGAGLIGIGNGRTQADKNAEMVSLLDFIPAAQLPNIVAGTSTYDATADFHTALAEMDGSGKTLLVPAGVYRVGELVIDGSNYKINSKGAWLHQLDGMLTSDAIHPIIRIPDTASNLDIGSWNLRGNLDDDADDLPTPNYEGMHGIAVISAKDIIIGDIHGEDILGDVIYTYGRDSSEAELSKNIRMGVISGSNIYRCIVAMAGGEATIAGIVCKGAVGYRDFDVEPNAGGDYQPVDADVGYVVGSQIQITSGDPAVINKRVRIGRVDLDGDRIADTTTPYPSHAGANALAFSLAYCDVVEVGKMSLANYDSYPVRMFGGWRDFRIGSVEFAACGGSENTLKSIIVQRDSPEGPLPVGATLTIGHITGALVNASGNAGRRVIGSFGGLLNVDIGSMTVTNGMIGLSLTGRIGINGTHDFGEGFGEIALNGCEKLVVSGMTIADAATTYGLFQCDEVTLIGCEGSFGSGFDYTGASTNIVSIGKAITGATGVSLISGEVRINGTKVLGAQGAAITDAAVAAGANPTKAEFDALVGKFNTLLARARAATPSIAT